VLFHEERKKERKKERKSIPKEVKRELLVEAGYRCSVPHCHHDSALDFHHIDGNPSNNSPKNLIVLCSNHHRLASLGKIDALACKGMKKTLRVQSFRFHGNLEFLKSMRKVIREELSKASDTKIKGKLRRVKGTDLFRRKTLFELLEGSLPSKYLGISVLGELKTPGVYPA
jgi:hypothetical protein